LEKAGGGVYPVEGLNVRLLLRVVYDEEEGHIGSGQCVHAGDGFCPAVRLHASIDCLQTNKGPILQTSSEICGTLPEDYTAHLGDIIFRLLPAGSITGAPKPKTVEIIAQAEDYRRGFYTGIMGHYADGQLDSAVMIRFIEQENGQLHFKAGGGITAKSRWESEYNEVIQKIYVPIY
jgi:para-aminobenzoate synthetase component I